MDYIEEIGYPDVDDEYIAKKLYRKREFYLNRYPEYPKFNSYEELKKYREDICTPNIKPRRHQLIASAFLNPDSPYKGLLIYHGLGSGKTMTAITIAEQFKDIVRRYGTKIHVLVPSILTKYNFKQEILKGTNNAYMRYSQQILNQLSKSELEEEYKIAMSNINQYYTIMSHKAWYQKVSGNRIAQKVGNKTVYKKDSEGNYERIQSADPIISLDNTLLIVDEAHNLTDNEYGEALIKVIKKSTNLKIVLLTGTPIINLADEIIDLLNFIRPINDPAKKELAFITPGGKGYDMKIKDINYLKKISSGYISYFKGADSATFAKRVDKGTIPKSLTETPVIQCKIGDFQYETYKEAIKLENDALDKASTAAANFVFPILDSSKSKIIGSYSINGLTILLNQLKYYKKNIINTINTQLFKNSIKDEDLHNFIYELSNNRIGGAFLKRPYLKTFSAKFDVLLDNIKELFETENDPSRIGFIYSNVVKAGGVELFAECMKENGYLEYSKHPYSIKDDTIDYKTGIRYKDFIKNYDPALFKPATYLLVIGSKDSEEGDYIEYANKIIKDIFNSVDNVEGKYIKFVLGSRVMNEGVTLRNCRAIHIIDVFYNIPKIEQAIGRVIRDCVHMNVITDTYRFPEVHVYKYIIGLPNDEVSSEEIMYSKAEKKYNLVKQVENILKEVSIDCPLLYNANVDKDQQYKCINSNNDKIDISLLDYSTFNDSMLSYELDNIKNKIKDCFTLKSIYEYSELYDYVKLLINELFEEQYLIMALSSLTNEDTIMYDKYGNSGYLIRRKNYYIFQRHDQDVNTNIEDREIINFSYHQRLSLNKYILSSSYDNPQIYNFDNTANYYLSRPRNDIIGIIDSIYDKKTQKFVEIFKISTNIKDKFTKGTVCTTGMSKKKLNSIFKKLTGSNIESNQTKTVLCCRIKEALLELELKSDKPMTYIIIPSNHPDYPFPYNLADRSNS